MRYLLWIILPLVLSNIAFAKETRDIFFGSASETVEIPFGEKTTLIFNKKVKSHSRSSTYEIRLDDESDPNYRAFSITPRFTTGTDNLSFVLEDGKVARLRFSTIPASDEGFMELTYEIRPRMYEDVSKAPPIGEIELLKAMIRDDSVAGYKRTVLSQSVPSGRKGVTSKLVRTFKGRNLHGYVFELTNHLVRNKVKIDVRKLTLGNPNLAILSQADSLVLYPKKSSKGSSESLVRIVAKPSSNFRAVRMPMTTLKEKKEKK